MLEIRIPRWPKNTLLHRVVDSTLEEFAALARKRGMAVRFIERTFREYLHCGDVRRGHAVVKCETCDHSEMIPLSCKRRGVCPACAERRMVAGAARLVDRVLPMVPYRHWVVSYPFSWNMKLAFRPELLDAVERLVAKVVREWLRRRGSGGQVGFVLFRHRFNSDLAIHIHVHLLICDGVFQEDDNQLLRLASGTEATKKELHKLARELLAQLKALVKEHEEKIAENDKSGKPAHRPAQLDLLKPSDDGARREPPNGGTSLVVRESEGQPLAAGRYVRAEDLHLFVSEVIRAEERTRLERLCGYLLRPAFSPERLAERPDGMLTYRLSKPDESGNTMLVMQPVDFMMRLASLIPAPTLKTVRYYGVLAPGSRDRAQVTPPPNYKVVPSHWATWLPLGPLATVLPLAPLAVLLYCVLLPNEAIDATIRPRLTEHDGEWWNNWVSLLPRIWGFQQLTCPCCGGRMHPIKVETVPIGTRRRRKPRWATGPPLLSDAAAQPPA